MCVSVCLCLCVSVLLWAAISVAAAKQCENFISPHRQTRATQRCNSLMSCARAKQIQCTDTKLTNTHTHTHTYTGSEAGAATTDVDAKNIFLRSYFDRAFVCLYLAINSLSLSLSLALSLSIYRYSLDLCIYLK